MNEYYMAHTHTHTATHRVHQYHSLDGNVGGESLKPLAELQHSLQHTRGGEVLVGLQVERETEEATPCEHLGVHVERGALDCKG